jgi:hypothetical protein
MHNQEKEGHQSEQKVSTQKKQVKKYQTVMFHTFPELPHLCPQGLLGIHDTVIEPRTHNQDIRSWYASLPKYESETLLL